MLDLILVMGSVILSWLLFFLLFSGLGLAVLRALGQSAGSGWLILDSFWLGWAFSIGLLQFWHFAFPVNDTILVILAIVACIMWYTQRRHFTRAVLRLLHQRAFLLLFGALLLWMANRALGMPIAYDTGFRDLQAVAWIDTYAIVPGLSNLFSSLGFNHSVYLYDALLDTAIWSGRSFRIATGLLLVVYLAYASRSVVSLFRCRQASDLRWSSIVALFVIPYILHYTVRWGGITHFLTDTAVDIIGFLTLIYLLDFLQYWEPRPGASNYSIFRLAVIILIGLTVKQSFIVYGLATAALVLIIWVRRGGFRLGWRSFAAIVIPIGILASALVIPWMARGVVTSGYMAFPHSVGRFEFDWTLSTEQLEGRQRNLASMTRQRGASPSEVLSSQEWLGPWLENFVGNVFPTFLPSVIALGALLFYAGGRLHHHGHEPSHRVGLWVFSPILIMLIVWFVSFPEEKYVRYLFWSAAAVSAILAFLSWYTVNFRLRVAAVFALTGVCLVYVLFLVVRHQTGPLSTGPDDGFHDHYLPVYNEYEASHGLIVNVPQFGVQCWLNPLPCTPYPNPNLRERVPGEIEHGFRVELVESTDTWNE